MDVRPEPELSLIALNANDTPSASWLEADAPRMNAPAPVRSSQALNAALPSRMSPRRLPIVATAIQLPGTDALELG